MTVRVLLFSLVMKMRPVPAADAGKAKQQYRQSSVAALVALARIAITRFQMLIGWRPTLECRESHRKKNESCDATEMCDGSGNSRELVDCESGCGRGHILPGAVIALRRGESENGTADNK
jgi:hypothetical protein